ncbi:unnamed protein product (macronuclear) [Paramecium tetraurelia]|uniref:EGF-like domain-containing protein n=1 Tax=Paramecium tetraurelia TaxID=5888 RepID=A0C6B5_PARTE|nr:uncharacterized protein GSPATT00035461001 [Paramecium tetraurelia]CAK66332.1 unnamed protein product [Paramecium tetraurelia]|eukprot:XP_001433729.1 hypothetical protein (macronuclear) [Paramecium tetraurelia strain d4-2]
MIIFILLKCISPTSLIYKNFFDSFTYTNNGNTKQSYIGWSILSKDVNHQKNVVLCGSKNILFLDNQSTQYNLLLHKSFKLEVHYQVTVQFQLWMLDNWINNQLLIYFDNEIIINDQYSCSSSAINICQGSQNDEVTTMSLSVLHNRPSIQIVIFAQSGKMGISEFQLFIEECPSGCHSCDIMKCHNSVLFMQSFTSIMISAINSEGWMFSGTIQAAIDNCHDIFYHKSSGYNLEKEIQLKDHWAVSLNLKVMIFNSGSTTISIKIDDILVQQEIYTQGWISYSNSNVNYDGFWYYMTIKHVSITQYIHTKPVIKITVLTTMTSVYTAWAPWFGIRDFQLFIHPNYVCIDHNLNPFDGCFSFNFDCVQGCKNCVKGICMHCLDGWQYIEISKSCIPYCGDNIINSQEECDDGNQNPYDGCYNCKFSCPLDCELCKFGKCLQRMNYYSLQKSQNECLPYNFVSNPQKREQYKLPICQTQRFSNYYSIGIPFYLEKENKHTCSHNCHVCDFGTCLQCKPNYILQNQLCINVFEKNDDEQQQEYFVEIFYLKVIQETQNYFKKQKFNRIQFNFKYYQNYENNYPNLDYIDNCKNKVSSVCLECEIGYKLNVNGRACIPLCTDGMVVNYEICQNQNYQQVNGCFKCQFSCQLECLSCLNGICQVCLEGWQLVNGTCQQVCGDGLIAALSQEQCDDTNLIDGDGCYQCFFQCMPYCQYCINQKECLNCEEHFEWVENQCKPICGDLFIVQELEECDDGNQISSDGCDYCQFQCKFDCQICVDRTCIDNNNQQDEPTSNDPKPTTPQVDNSCNQGCLLCQEDICQECEKYSTLEDGQCIKCGNGYKSDDEFCDDGNTFNNDGCSNQCMIEQGWDCNLSILQFSQCYQFAELSLKFLNQSFDTQHISLTYTKKVKLNEFNQFFLDQMSFDIENIKQNQYNINIEPVIPIILESARDINYIIKITFLEKIQSRPKLTVSIDAQFLDENQILVPPGNSEISLMIPQVMNLKQMEATAKMQVFGQNMMIGMGSVGASFQDSGCFVKQANLSTQR